MENGIIRPEWVPSAYLEAYKKCPLPDHEKQTDKAGVHQPGEKVYLQERLATKIAASRKLKRKR